MEQRQGPFTRSVLLAVWAVAALGVAAWLLLAWGGHALLSDSGSRLFAFIDPWVASAVWDQRIETLLHWGERLGTAAVWGVWALGAAGLLLAAVFSTWLYLRAERAMASPR